jgi:hypothetical protein
MATNAIKTLIKDEFILKFKYNSFCIKKASAILD